MPHRIRATLILAVFLPFAAAFAGEKPGAIPEPELLALERAISRELNSNYLGSQTLGDLYKLQRRLLAMQATAAAQAKSETASALEPLNGDDSQSRLLDRLLREAAAGGRAAKRSLSLYYLYLNDPEKALHQWRLMGKTTDYDLNYLVMSAYMELALGEYTPARRNLETAIRHMETRSSLVVSTPVFCQTIAGYRTYIKRQEGNLLPGEEILIYVEVEGAEFASTADGGAECRLMFGLQLRDDSQKTVWADPNWGEYDPAFAGPVRDLHAALSWRVPNDLEPGRYHLTVDVVEDSTKRRGENTAGFFVGRRETNPERRPVPALNPAGLPPGYNETGSLYDLQRQALKAFPGAPALPMQPGTGSSGNSERSLMDMRDPEFLKRFEMLKDYERQQKVD